MDHGQTAKIPEEDEMEIPLINNWEEVYKPRQAKVYPLGHQDRVVVDEAFNKLHQQGRLEWTNKLTPFSHPYFVIWKDSRLNGIPKGQVVVNI